MPALNSKFNTDPFFYFGLEKNMLNPENLNSVHINNYFEYNLKQDPNNLSCHLQRVKFVSYKKKYNELFAALCDLYIILGHQGLSLRQRLFNYAQQKLPQEQLDILAAHLTENNMCNTLDFLPEHCFFKKEAIDLLTGHTQSQEADSEVENVLHTIESYIEHSQFDVAEDYLLKHLEHDPDNEQLTEKLINLYKALNYRDKFNQAYKQFGNCLLTSRHWDEANNYFLENS